MTFKLDKPDSNRGIIEVTDQVVHQMAEGLGFNWYSCYTPETYPAADDDDRWARIFAHAEWLNMRFIRFGQWGGKICDNAGTFSPGHESFAQLKRVSDWAERWGASIILDPFAIPNAFQYQSWPGAPGVWGRAGQYSLGVRDIDGYVGRFVVPYVRHAVKELGCKAVTWFNHVNEPLQGNICATPPGIDDHARYVEVLNAIRQGLDEAGLADIGNMGPDTHTHHYWPIDHMLEIGADPDPAIQAYCMHHYHSRFDWDVATGVSSSRSMTESIEQCLRRYCRYAHEKRKPYLVTEIGMFHFGWSVGDPAGIARHDNTILEAEFIVRGMAEGADGFLRWAWLNPTSIDGWWQLIETVDGSDAPVRDPYNTYATLYRYVSRRAEIMKVEVTQETAGRPRTLHATATRNADGSRTLLVVNDFYATCVPVTIRFPTGGASAVRKIVNDPVRKHHECEVLAVSGGQIEIADVLSPMSLTVYTTCAKTEP